MCKRLKSTENTAKSSRHMRQTFQILLRQTHPAQQIIRCFPLQTAARRAEVFETLQTVLPVRIIAVAQVPLLNIAVKLRHCQKSATFQRPLGIAALAQAVLHIGERRSRRRWGGKRIMRVYRFRITQQQPK